MFQNIKLIKLFQDIINKRNEKKRMKFSLRNRFQNKYCTTFFFVYFYYDFTPLRK